MKLLLILLVCINLFGFNQVHNNTSFNKAKKQMYMKVYKDKKETFYCKNPYEYRFNEKAKRKINWIYPDEKFYTPRNPITKKGDLNIRTQRIEAEHIFPAYNFGRQMTCWRDGDSSCVVKSGKKKGKKYKGRKCCIKVSRKFKLMQADLHNLVPAIGEVNADRLNFRYMDTRSNLKGQYGQCEMKVDFKERKAYPANYTKGMISRAYLYMINTYDIKVSSSELKLIKAWNKIYPVSEWEKIRNKRIYSIQGNKNPYVK